MSAIVKGFARNRSIPTLRAHCFVSSSELADMPIMNGPSKRSRGPLHTWLRHLLMLLMVGVDDENGDDDNGDISILHSESDSERECKLESGSSSGVGLDESD